MLAELAGHEITATVMDTFELTWYLIALHRAPGQSFMFLIVYINLCRTHRWCFWHLNLKFHCGQKMWRSAAVWNLVLEEMNPNPSSETSSILFRAFSGRSLVFRLAPKTLVKAISFNRCSTCSGLQKEVFCVATPKSSSCVNLRHYWSEQKDVQENCGRRRLGADQAVAAGN